MFTKKSIKWLLKIIQLTIRGYVSQCFKTKKEINHYTNFYISFLCH